jgi:hypothetical protein
MFNSRDLTYYQRHCLDAYIFHKKTRKIEDENIRHENLLLFSNPELFSKVKGKDETTEIQKEEQLTQDDLDIILKSLSGTVTGKEAN